MAALGLHCCTRALSSCGERGLLFLAVCGLLVVVASLVEKLFRGMWDLPGPALEPVSPALAGGFLTTAPPGEVPEDILHTIPILSPTWRVGFNRSVRVSSGNSVLSCFSPRYKAVIFLICYLR